MSHRHEGRRSFLALLTVVLATAITLGPVARADAQTTMRVGVVIDLGNGTVRNIPVTMSGTEATGAQVLQAAGLNPTLRGFGGIGQAVCALVLDGVTLGCPADNSCLTCAAPAAWSYSRAANGASSFTYSSVGAGATKVHDGDVEGWRWTSSTSPPPFTPFSTFFPPPPPATAAPEPMPTVVPASPGAPSGPSATTPAGGTPAAPGAPSGGGSATPAPTSGVGVTGTAPPASGTAPGETAAPPTTGARDRSPGATAFAADGPDNESGSDAIAGGPPRVEPDESGSAAAVFVLVAVFAGLGGAVVAVRIRRRRAQPV